MTDNDGPPLDYLGEMRKTAELYYELLYAVEKKVLGESRHETALRYILEGESHPVSAAKTESKE